MKIEKVYSCLCSYDSRNPLFGDLGWIGEEFLPKPAEENCACDNCFYRRDELAREIIRLTEGLEDIRGSAEYEAHKIAKETLTEIDKEDKLSNAKLRCFIERTE